MFAWLKYLNPFSHLVESRHYKLSRFYGSSFYEKLGDAFYAFSGFSYSNDEDKFPLQFGIVDWLTGFVLSAITFLLFMPIGFILIKAFPEIKNRDKDDNKKSKLVIVIGIIFLIPLGLLFLTALAIRLTVSVILTMMFIPVVAMIHGISLITKNKAAVDEVLAKHDVFDQKIKYDDVKRINQECHFQNKADKDKKRKMSDNELYVFEKMLKLITLFQSHTEDIRIGYVRKGAINKSINNKVNCLIHFIAICQDDSTYKQIYSNTGNVDCMAINNSKLTADTISKFKLDKSPRDMSIDCNELLSIANRYTGQVIKLTINHNTNTHYELNFNLAKQDDRKDLDTLSQSGVGGINRNLGTKKIDTIVTDFKFFNQLEDHLAFIYLNMSKAERVWILEGRSVIKIGRNYNKDIFNHITSYIFGISTIEAARIVDTAHNRIHNPSRFARNSAIIFSSSHEIKNEKELKENKKCVGGP